MLSVACSAGIHIQPRTIFPTVTQSIVGWSPSHYSLIKKMSHRHGQGALWWNQAFSYGPLLPSDSSFCLVNKWPKKRDTDPLMLWLSIRSTGYCQQVSLKLRTDPWLSESCALESTHPFFFSKSVDLKNKSIVYNGETSQHLKGNLINEGLSLP